MQAKFNNKDKKGNGKWYGKRGRGSYHNNGDMDSQNFNKPIERKEEARRNLTKICLVLQLSKVWALFDQCYVNKKDSQEDEVKLAR